MDELEKLMRAIVATYEARGWSRREFARQLGWTPARLSRFLTMTCAVSFIECCEMASALGTSISELLQIPEKELSSVQLKQKFENRSMIRQRRQALANAG